jgi:hypothetical protein
MNSFINQTERLLQKPNPTQEKIDAILDKINKEGVASLSEEKKNC